MVNFRQFEKRIAPKKRKRDYKGLVAQSVHRAFLAVQAQRALQVPRVKMERPVRKVIADLQARQALRAVRVSRAHKVNQACKAHRVSQVHRVNLDSGVRRALQVKT